MTLNDTINTVILSVMRKFPDTTWWTPESMADVLKGLNTESSVDDSNVFVVQICASFLQLMATGKIMSDKGAYRLAKDDDPCTVGDISTIEAFEWLILPDSPQAEMLENAMRNYDAPAYDPADVGKHLEKALTAPVDGFMGDLSKVQMTTLAIAIISHAVVSGWDTVPEPGA